MFYPQSDMSPCRDCKDRFPGCHDKCERYKEWKTKWEAKRDKIKDNMRQQMKKYPSHLNVKGTKGEKYLET